MKTYQTGEAGVPVEVTFQFEDEAGTSLTPTAVSYRVLDENGVAVERNFVYVDPIGTIGYDIIWNWRPVPGGTTFSSDITFTIPAGVNIPKYYDYLEPDGLLQEAAVPPPAKSIRIVELKVVTDTGTTIITQEYLLQNGLATTLAFGEDSFQSYAEATLRSTEFTAQQLTGWAAASRDSRERALVQAYQRILKLPLRTSSGDGWAQNKLTNDSVISNISGRLPFLTPTEMASLEPRLLVALRSAQLVEADDILVDDPVRKTRESGVISMTVGESSQFFKSTNPLDLGVSSRTLKYLQPWIRIGAQIGRS